MKLSATTLKRVGRWLAEPRHVWATLFAIAVALAIVITFRQEPLIRLTGLVMQWFGIGTVIWGISQTRALFGHPSLAVQAKAWLERHPFRPRRIVMAVGAAEELSFAGRGEAYVTHGAGPDATVEARLEALEKNIAALHSRISNKAQQLEGEIRQATDKISAESHARQTADDDLRKKLEISGTGGLHISAIGAALLFVGVTLSTASVEIANWLK